MGGESQTNGATLSGDEAFLAAEAAQEKAFSSSAGFASRDPTQ